MLLLGASLREGLQLFTAGSDRVVRCRTNPLAQLSHPLYCMHISPALYAHLTSPVCTSHHPCMHISLALYRAWAIGHPLSDTKKLDSYHGHQTDVEAACTVSGWLFTAGRANEHTAASNSCTTGPATAWCCMVLHATAWCCLVLHAAAWCLLPGAACYCLLLPGGAWWCMLLHAACC